MGFLQDYTRKVNATGMDNKERYQNDTNGFIWSNFKDSPNYRLLEVYKNAEFIGEKDARVVSIERMGSIRNILLKPSEDLEVGNMVVFDNLLWMLFDKFGSPESHVKLTAQKTNQYLKWINAEGVLQAVRCIVSASDLGAKSKQNRSDIEYNKYDVKLPYGQLYIFMETSYETNKIDLNHRFIIGNIVYEVIGVDNTTLVEDNYGVIQFTVRRTPAQEEDDFELGIAYNDYKLEQNSNYSKDSNSSESADDDIVTRGGGRLW